MEWWRRGQQVDDAEQLGGHSAVSRRRAYFHRNRPPFEHRHFRPGTPFDGITFASPAGGFTLKAASIVLTNDIVDNQVVVNESVNLPLTLNATHNLNVTGSGVLTIGNVISGAAGAGITAQHWSSDIGCKAKTRALG